MIAAGDKPSAIGEQPMILGKPSLCVFEAEICDGVMSCSGKCSGRETVYSITLDLRIQKVSES